MLAPGFQSVWRSKSRAGSSASQRRIWGWREPSLQQNVLFRASYFSAIGDEMIRVAAAIFAAVIGASAASAQTTTGSADKQDTACTTSPSASSGHGEEKTPNSQTVRQERSAARYRWCELCRTNGAERQQAAESLPGLPAGFHAEVVSAT
jgi:hypothetical protein